MTHALAQRGLAPQEATVFLAHDGQEQKLGPGTAQVDGPWLHFWPDEPDRPASSYPIQQVNAVEWKGDRDWR